MIAKTPLHASHVMAGARMVAFHGWDMPLHYGSQIEEHHAVRHHAGMFDVSHMTVVDILGAGTRQFLRKILANDVDRLTHQGRALYSCMCNARGGIIDDLVVYQRAPDNYRLVLNSATREHDLAWLRERIEGFAAGLQERHELAMLAIQGPEAFARITEVLTPSQADAISTLTPFECVDVADWFFARTGYTGEDGLEIIMPQDCIVPLWDALLQAGVQPCGLGARDTLRLESGLMLYGQDMDETTSPLESGLAWTIQWEPADRDFIGMGALLSQKDHGINRKMVGLVAEGKGIMRTGMRVVAEGLPDGIITSGTWSPTRGQAIALARVPAETGSHVMVDIRGTLTPAKVGPPRFVRKGISVEF